MNMINFSEKLILARREKGYTQDEFARRLGVTPQAVSKWERNNSYPDVELLCSIAKILECSLDYLLDIRLNTSPLTENEDEKIRNKIVQNALAEPLMIKIGTSLIELFIEEIQMHFTHLYQVKESLSLQYGYILPLVRILDTAEVEEYAYHFYSYDKLIGSGTIEPFTNYEEEKERAIHTIMNHFQISCFEHYTRILNKEIVNIMIQNINTNYPSIIGNLIPDKISLNFLVKLLRKLIENGKSIRNLIKIIEVLEDEYEKLNDLDYIVKIIMDSVD